MSIFTNLAGERDKGKKKGTIISRIVLLYKMYGNLNIGKNSWKLGKILPTPPLLSMEERPPNNRPPKIMPK